MNSIFLISIIVSIVSLSKATNHTIEDKRHAFEEVARGFNMTGKVVLITGSGFGIGAGTARLFCYLGAQVVITNSDLNSVKEVAKECQQLSPNKHRLLGVLADMTKEEDVKRLVDETIKNYGKVDILVNVAGDWKTALITDPNYLEVFDHLIKINLRTNVHILNLLVPYLKQTNGSVVNVAGLSAKLPIVRGSAYAATKAAIVQLTKTLGVELGPHIRINCVSPGYVGDIPAPYPQANAEYLAKIRSKTALGREARVNDVAKGILFFASPLASWITGQTLDIDGGFYGDLNGL